MQLRFMQEWLRMVWSKSLKLPGAWLVFGALLFAFPCFAQPINYRFIEPRKGGEPLPKAIISSSKKSMALISYKGRNANVSDGMELDEEWIVKTVNPESIVFGKNSERRFIEYYVEPSRRPKRRHRNWYLYGLPVTLWEGLNLLCEAFGKSCAMHNLCQGSVKPDFHGKNLFNLMGKLVTGQNKWVINRDSVFLVPAYPPNEDWKEIFRRKERFSHQALSVRFPGLGRVGFIDSSGDDIQYILRVISLGGEVPISFPENMHFPVYASYKSVPFSKILCDIAYINQCIVVERELGLDVLPWSGKKEKKNIRRGVGKEPVPLPFRPANLITADPAYTNQYSGSGPYPPVLPKDSRSAPRVVTKESGKTSVTRRSPIVHQNGFKNR